MGAITFFAPDFGETAKLVYAYVTYSLMMIVYSLINVPYVTLLVLFRPTRLSGTHCRPIVCRLPLLEVL